MSRETTPYFLPAEKPHFYHNDIMSIHKKIILKNEVLLPDLTDADLVIPMQINHQIVGFGFLFFNGDVVTLMRMVDPDKQGKGLGHLILEEIERVARSKGAKQLVSQVIDTPSARNALIKAGFELEDHLDDGKIKFVKNLTNH